MSNRPKKAQPSLRMTVAERAEQAAREANAPAERRRKITIIIGSVVGVLVLVGVVAAIVLSNSGSDTPVEVNATARELGCTSCHSVDGNRSEGPTWKGLWDSEVQLTDGSTVVADEEYFRRSIEDPAAQVRVGFTPTMPTLDVTEDQMQELIAYMKTLK